METNELKRIWQTLSNEKLIDKSIAKENIERIIKAKSSRTIKKLNKKLQFDFIINVATSILVLAITIFATLYLNQKNQHLPVQGYIFLLLVISYYALKAVSLNSKLKLLDISYSTFSILDSLKKVKSKFEKVSKTESVLIYVSLSLLTVFANFILNYNTDISKFSINSLQGYVLLFSIGYLISLPFIGKYYFNKRFSGIIKDLNNSIEELKSNN
jgi:CDP-diglyceride synthetase